MKNSIKKLITSVIAIVLLMASCSKDDGQEQKVILSSAKQLSSFTFSVADNTAFAQDVTASINEEAKTISATLPSDIDLTALTPTLVVSTKASVSPTGAQNFMNPVTYTVTAEDGTKATYTATFESDSSAKQITSFVFLLTNNPIEINVIGVIDEETKTIAVTMPIGTNISGLLPEIEIPDTATVNTNAVQDFTNSVAYTVTAEDGSEVIYTVTVTKLLSPKEILQTILDANPNNTLGWDLANTIDLGALNGVSTNTAGDIIDLDLGDVNLVSIPVEIGNLVSFG